MSPAGKAFAMTAPLGSHLQTGQLTCDRPRTRLRGVGIFLPISVGLHPACELCLNREVETYATFQELLPLPLTSRADPLPLTRPDIRRDYTRRMHPFDEDGRRIRLASPLHGIDPEIDYPPEYGSVFQILSQQSSSATERRWLVCVGLTHPSTEPGSD